MKLVLKVLNSNTLLTKVKETPGIMMKTVIEIHPSVMDYKAISKALGLREPQREPLYPNGENSAQ